MGNSQAPGTGMDSMMAADEPGERVHCMVTFWLFWIYCMIAVDGMLE